MSHALTLSTEDTLALSRLPGGAYDDVMRKLQWLAPACASIAAGDAVIPTLQRCARASGVTYPTYRRLYYAFNKHGWEGLLNKSSHPIDRDIGLPAAFRLHVKTVIYGHLRAQTGREAHRKIVRQWQAWRAGDISQAIPGYSLPPDPDPFTGLPAGWSQPNIARLKPSAYHLKVRRNGTAAGKELLPTIRRTRVGLEFGQAIQVDDQDYDTYINLLGRSRQAMRPAGFNALEVLSAMPFAWCAKPQTVDSETGKQSRLKEEDHVWFTIDWLTTHGYRADVGTVIMAERGTAAIRNAIAQGLGSATGGKLTVMTGGILGETLMSGLQFKGAPKGNFRFKAHVESHFALIRTMAAHLIGATGVRDNSPDENYSLIRYNDNLLKQAEKLSPARRELLIKLILSWPEFTQSMALGMDLMARRDWHNLEGWEACGFCVDEVRGSKASDEWISYDDVIRMQDATYRQFLLGLFSVPGHFRRRNLSPKEVWDSNKHKLTKLSRHLWNRCVPNDYAANVPVLDNRTIRVPDRAPGSTEPLIYMARVRNIHGRVEHLAPGDQVRVYANPFSPAQALICDQHDAGIGIADLIPAVSVIDSDGAIRVHSSVRQFRAELDSEIRPHLAGLATQREHMTDRNKTVLAGEAVTDEDRAHARRQRRAARTAATIMDDDDAVTPILTAPAGDQDVFDQ